MARLSGGNINPALLAVRRPYGEMDRGASHNRAGLCTRLARPIQVLAQSSLRVYSNDIWRKIDSWESSLNIMNPRGPEVSGPALHDPSHWTRPGGDLPTGAPNRHANRAPHHGQTETGVGGREPPSRSWSLPYRVKMARPQSYAQKLASRCPQNDGAWRYAVTVLSNMFPLFASDYAGGLENHRRGRTISVSRPKAKSPVHILVLRASNVRPNLKTDNRLHESFADISPVIRWPYRLCASVVDGKHLADGLNASGLTPLGDARRFQGPKRSGLSRHFLLPATGSTRSISMLCRALTG